jgi:hypothetical protein
VTGPVSLVLNCFELRISCFEIAFSKAADVDGCHQRQTDLATTDALSNRALYSREPLQQFWDNTVEQSRGMRIWNIDFGKLTISLIKDFL